MEVLNGSRGRGASTPHAQNPLKGLKFVCEFRDLPNVAHFCLAIVFLTRSLPKKANMRLPQGSIAPQDVMHAGWLGDQQALELAKLAKDKPAYRMAFPLPWHRKRQSGLGRFSYKQRTYTPLS